MVGLLDGGIAGIFGAAFGALYIDAIYHQRIQPTLDAGGSAIGGGWADLPCRAQPEQVDERVRQQFGYTDRDQRILVLASTLAAQPSTDDEITLQGQRWAIGAIGRDPAGAYWDLKGIRA